MTKKHTIKLTNSCGLKVEIEHYGCPAQAPNLHPVMMLNALDQIEEKFGWKDRNYEGYSPKCIVADMCMYMDKERIVSKIINFPAFVKALKEEAYEFMVDITCYLHAVGALYGNQFQDACWSTMNSLKYYIAEHWSMENRGWYFTEID